MMPTMLVIVLVLQTVDVLVVRTLMCLTVVTGTVPRLMKPLEPPVNDVIVM